MLSQYFHNSRDCLLEKLNINTEGTAGMEYIKVAASEGSHHQPIELPLEPDGTLLFCTLKAQFPGASGMNFRADSGALRALRQTDDGKIHAPQNGWQDRTYLCVDLNVGSGMTEYMVSQWKEMQEDLKDLRMKFAALYAGECGNTVGAAIREYQLHPDLYTQFKIFCSLSDEEVQTLKSKFIDCNNERKKVAHEGSHKIENFKVDELRCNLILLRKSDSLFQEV